MLNLNEIGIYLLLCLLLEAIINCTSISKCYQNLYTARHTSFSGRQEGHMKTMRDGKPNRSLVYTRR
ncbi:unnamed protein product [Lathyrus oleraceus]